MMSSGQIFRRCLLSAAVVAAETNVKTSPKNENVSNSCRPSELPIYSKDEAKNVRSIEPQENPGYIESVIRDVRVIVTKYSDELKAYKRVGVDHIDKSVENIEWLIDYLRQEDHTLPKAGAIGIGALTGLIFGLRGGIFKKTLYATTGALGMGALCYPKEAAEYSQVGLTEAKKYATIAYNFAYGVKKDEPPLELPSLPKFSLIETWDSVKSTASSLISDNQGKPAEVLKEVKEQVKEDHLDIFQCKKIEV